MRTPILLALALGLAASQAQAGVNYAFTGSLTTYSFQPGPTPSDPPVVTGIDTTLAFSLTRLDFITADISLSPASCSISDPTKSCGAAMGFALNGLGVTGKPAITFSLTGPSGADTNIFFFPVGSFAAFGTYTALGLAAPPLDYVSDGQATLVVSYRSVGGDTAGGGGTTGGTAVPEPAGMAMLGVGLLGLGVVRRRG